MDDPPSSRGLGGGVHYAPDTAEIDFDLEPPLLEELGINFEHIVNKTVAVLMPTRQLNRHILDDAGVQWARTRIAVAI
jgi:hypothetical protein